MRRCSWIVLIVIGFGAIGVASWYRASRLGGDEGPVPAKGTPAPGSVIVSSLPAERTFSQQIPWIGTVESQASVELRALQAGRVESLDAGDQTFVQAGTTVIRLGGPQVETQRARLQTEVESAKSQLELARQTVLRRHEDVKQQL